ncbi:hypothetical protein EW146_g6652 [Bondarzewia mesenterica]|uniref:Eukaryotic integral membrane protein n=1 Tax=Bondarzewia mesenterica TaxID=1095465 RepID=A0A4S4LPU0_9AGAM|nr:hypothetical protein EW146_g6652 [Bondarzewia mesenterica]
MAILSSPLQLISSVPPVTRFFTAATAVSSLFYFWLRWKSGDGFSAPYLVLIPGSSLFYPWTFFTSVFVETSVIELIVSLIFVPPCLRYLERLWGAVETIKFIVASVTFSNVIAFGLNWIEYIVLRNADLLLYGMQYHGQMALQIAILVAFTQLIPEHQVQVFGVLKARVKTLPMAYVTFSTVMCIIGFQCPYIVIQFGFFVGWIWLRFYKKNSGDVVGGDAYGDRSETFAFVHWFPPFLHTPITLLSNVTYKYASRFHLIPGGADLEANGYSQLPGSARAEAERRRAMALKALDQRMANSSPAPGSSAPRPPPAAAPSKPEDPPMPSSPERGKSPEVPVDMGKGKAREDAR